MGIKLSLDWKSSLIKSKEKERNIKTAADGRQKKKGIKPVAGAGVKENITERKEEKLLPKRRKRGRNPRLKEEMIRIDSRQMW